MNKTFYNRVEIVTDHSPHACFWTSFWGGDSQAFNAAIALKTTWPGQRIIIIDLTKSNRERQRAGAVENWADDRPIIRDPLE